MNFFITPGTGHGQEFIMLSNSCSGLEVIKLFSYSTQLSMKFKMLISVKMSRNSAFLRLR